MCQLFPTKRPKNKNYILSDLYKRNAIPFKLVSHVVLVLPAIQETCSKENVIEKRCPTVEEVNMKSARKLPPCKWYVCQSGFGNNANIGI